MSNAPPLGVLTDEETSKHSTGEIVFKPLAPIKVKGKVNAIAIFKPVAREVTTAIGVSLERKIRFPWHDNILDGSTLNSKDPVSTCKAKVQHLCSIKKWPAGTQVEALLGGPYNKALHTGDQTVGVGTSRSKAPLNSPFDKGGLVVLEGATGLGKIELAEHIVTHCAMQFAMMPIFGTMGPRPGESARMIVELIRSTIAIYRNIGGNVPT